MHFTVLSLFKLFACSKSFNVLLLTNMKKKSSESPDHDLHLCSRFCPLSRCWKEVFATLHNGAELYVRQHHHGPTRLILFKNTLAYPEKCCFRTVYIIHAKFTTATILLLTLEFRIKEQFAYWKKKKKSTYTHLFGTIRLLIFSKKTHLYFYSHLCIFLFIFQFQ